MHMCINMYPWKYVGFQLVIVIAFPGQVMSADSAIILQRFTILRGFDPLL